MAQNDFSFLLKILCREKHCVTSLVNNHNSLAVRCKLHTAGSLWHVSFTDKGPLFGFPNNHGVKRVFFIFAGNQDGSRHHRNFKKTK
ncbi:NADH-quinone oxidoreductase subunit F 1, partial [Frankliniella fusca]